MRRHFLPVCFLIVVCLGLGTCAVQATNGLRAGVQIGYGTTSYSSILGKNLPQTSGWSAGLWSEYYFNDLLFTALYQGASTFKNQGLNRGLVQVSADYLFLEEELLRVYGGLGYQYSHNSVDNPIVDGKRTTFSGHGFVGQVVIRVPIADLLDATISLTGNPWMNWKIGQGNNTTTLPKRTPSFVYRLELAYELNNDLQATLGLLGGAFSTADYAGKGITKGSYTDLSLGISYRF